MGFDCRFKEAYMTQEGVSLGLMFGTPVYTDTADEENIYVGYCRINEFLDKDEENILVCKIHINGNETIKYFAYGKWENRTHLQYK